MEANADGSAEELVDAIFTTQFPPTREGVEAFDDQTIVAIKVKGPATQKVTAAIDPHSARPASPMGAEAFLGSLRIEQLPIAH